MGELCIKKVDGGTKVEIDSDKKVKVIRIESL